MLITSFAGLVLGLGQSVLAQDLPSVLGKYPETSTFQGLINQIPGGAAQLLPSGLKPNSSNGVTLLVPSNKAFTNYLNATGIANISSVPQDQLLTLLSYHVMYAKMTSANFSAPGGLIVPTLLQGQKYNNRSAGAELIKTYGAEAAKGNVLYVSKDPINPVKFRVRQQLSNTAVLRGGLGQGGVMSVIDAQWDMGYVQVMDTVLTPPAPCSNTIKGKDTLTALDTALNNADLWDALDHSPNVTCLAPTNTAFNAAGNPQTTLNKTDLASALLFHTLPMALYSPYITSGTVIQSLGGPNVTVTKVDGDIYFNDAKVVSPNVLTNNGLIHVLDRVMSPNGTAPAATAKTPTSTATLTAGTATGTSSPIPKASNAAGRSAGGNAAGGLLAFLAAAVLF